MLENPKNKKDAVFRYVAQTLATYNKLIVHGFFTRLGGVSSSVYQSLNCNIQSSDSLEKVIKNQTIVCHALNFGYTNLRVLDQVHSSSVMMLEDPAQATSCLQADALVTRIPNLLLGIKTADCAPILFYDPKNNIIAAVHAGWKGALLGILDHTLFAMQDLGAKPANIVAAIGPCIQQASYEVDQNFYDQFAAKDSTNKQFFIDAHRKNYYLFDLPGYCLFRLKKLNIANIDNLGIDTYSNPNILFSFRRSTHEHNGLNPPIECGRQLSVIGILPTK